MEARGDAAELAEAADFVSRREVWRRRLDRRDEAIRLLAKGWFRPGYGSVPEIFETLWSFEQSGDREPAAGDAAMRELMRVILDANRGRVPNPQRIWAASLHPVVRAKPAPANDFAAVVLPFERLDGAEAMLVRIRRRLSSAASRIAKGGRKPPSRATVAAAADARGRSSMSLAVEDLAGAIVQAAIEARMNFKTATERLIAASGLTAEEIAAARSLAADTISTIRKENPHARAN